MEEFYIRGPSTESKAEVRKRGQQLQIDAEVEHEAIDQAAKLFSLNKRPEQPEDDEPRSKAPKLSTEARRFKKVHADLEEGANVLSQLEASGLKYTEEVKTSLRSGVQLLKQQFHVMTELQLEGKDIERHWTEASRLCVSLAEAIDMGSHRLSQAAK